jgi:hypothetical protein
MSYTSIAFEVSEFGMAILSLLQAIVIAVLMTKNYRVNKRLSTNRGERTEKFKQTVYCVMLILNIAILIEFALTWNYFWLTQIKLLVFMLANIGQTLTITYMVFMASRAVKEL